MGPQPAEHARRPQLAISADRIFDGYRWHNDAVILIDRGVVQCIAQSDQSAGDWPTEVMPSGRCLRPASSTCKSMVAAAFFSMMTQRRTRCERLLERIAGTASQAVYLL